jgi:hypothetical protein
MARQLAREPPLPVHIEQACELVGEDMVAQAACGERPGRRYGPLAGPWRSGPGGGCAASARR